ncbi:stage V sporulation protein AA [Priestia filamentosa]|uniref:stage V sporulation protein AA n=1 Tax=Priestia TaxID=2800373 RepID=UPI00077C8537|nr:MULTISPECIES: stage V sporulation protein AA [Priestia]KAB2493715.1 stage V sporulation protein AA [Priestia endophytica]KYG35955.1 stage V sporulation protein AA [Priestia endophytica]MBG9814899.1 stage V sporulation protein AA [Priestia endophytica]MCM3539480.1 stage V sporulation protein AA [Priestia endophytica]MCY8232813.1 stage V sporulation protein AA [Priestia endophytica]
MGRSVYIKMRHRVQVRPKEKITVGDVAVVFTSKEEKEKIESLVIYKVNEKDQNIIIIDVMRIIQAISREMENMEIQQVGPTQTIVEVVFERKRASLPFFIVVWLLLFIGAALAIMNFHEDVSMRAVHQRLFFILTGEQDETPLLLQVPYSIGLGLGMILFFNHVFKKRINEEPSPLEVEMFNYQQDLDRYVIINENDESVTHIDER